MRTTRRPSTSCLLLLAALLCPALSAQRLPDLAIPRPLPAGSPLVLGFLGGFEPWNDPHRSVRKLVLRLRRQPGVYAESIANHRRSVALPLILQALDTNRDGRLDSAEKAAARIILFGQSWGGAAALATARDLQRRGIPVLLTAQVDSVGLHDRVVPANVRAAVNFFQHDPLTIQGRPAIRAENPAATAILGNFRRTYLFLPEDEHDASWPRRTFGGSHVKMELDPEVWGEVEHYIAQALARSTP